MSTLTIVLLVILAFLAIALIAMILLGRRMQKKQDAQQEQLEAAAQQVSMLIIDKKRMKLKEAGFPQPYRRVCIG